MNTIWLLIDVCARRVSIDVFGFDLICLEVGGVTPRADVALPGGSFVDFYRPAAITFCWDGGFVCHKSNVRR